MKWKKKGPASSFFFFTFEGTLAKRHLSLVSHLRESLSTLQTAQRWKDIWEHFRITLVVQESFAIPILSREVNLWGTKLISSDSIILSWNIIGVWMLLWGKNWLREKEITFSQFRKVWLKKEIYDYCGGWNTNSNVTHLVHLCFKKWGWWWEGGGFIDDIKRAPTVESILNPELRWTKSSGINSGRLKENLLYYWVHQFWSTKEGGKCWDEERAGSSLYITYCPEQSSGLNLSEQPHTYRWLVCMLIPGRCNLKH